MLFEHPLHLIVEEAVGQGDDRPLGGEQACPHPLEYGEGKEGFLLTGPSYCQQVGHTKQRDHYCQSFGCFEVASVVIQGSAGLQLGHNNLKGNTLCKIH